MASAVSLDEFRWMYPDLAEILFDSSGNFRATAPLEMSKHLEANTPDISDSQQHEKWTVVQTIYASYSFFHQAIATMNLMYGLMGEWQISKQERMHKGLPLVWMGDQYSGLGMPWHAFRFTLLAFIEDIVNDGEWKKDRGAWFRLMYKFGLTEAEISQIVADILKFSEDHAMLARWPEIIMAAKQRDWPVRYPSSAEAAEYVSPSKCVRFLLEYLGKDVDLGLKSGDTLNYLAAALCSALPGARCVLLNTQTKSFEFDVVVSLDGRIDDFRGHWGRYLICECKDWKKSAGVSTVATMATRLDSTLASAALLFSSAGLSGKKQTRFGEREVLKFLQRSGKTIIVISKEDLEHVAGGISFLTKLRVAYDRLFLDLPS